MGRVFEFSILTRCDWSKHICVTRPLMSFRKWGPRRITYNWDPVKTWWRHQMEAFSALLALCAGNSPAPVNSPHKGQWRGALMFSLTCAPINDWVNNREAGDLRRRRGHCDAIVMLRCCHLKYALKVSLYVNWYRHKWVNFIADWVMIDSTEWPVRF